MQIKLQKH